MYNLEVAKQHFVRFCFVSIFSPNQCLLVTCTWLQSSWAMWFSLIIVHSSRKVGEWKSVERCDVGRRRIRYWDGIGEVSQKREAVGRLTEPWSKTRQVYYGWRAIWVGQNLESVISGNFFILKCFLNGFQLPQKLSLAVKSQQLNLIFNWNFVNSSVR